MKDACVGLISRWDSADKAPENQKTKTIKTEKRERTEYPRTMGQLGKV